MAMKLYIGGLDVAFSEADLEKLFTEQGKVTSVAIIKDRASNQSKGFGFVEMPDDKEAQAAIANLNGKEINGRKVTVNEARPQEERRPSGGGDFRRSY